MKRHGRNLSLAVILLLLFAVSCSAGNGTNGSERSSVPEKEEIFAAALNTVAPPEVDEDTSLQEEQEDGTAATAVPESVRLPAVMGDGGEALARAPESPVAQMAATPVESIDLAQAEATSEAQTSDPADTKTSSPTPATTPGQQTGRSANRVQTATVAARSEEVAEKAPESTSPATMEAPSLPVLVTATSIPSVEPPATAALFAEPEHFSGCAARTGGNASVAFPHDIGLSGLVLDTGDEIAVFASDGVLCAGSAVWTGQNIAIAAWADNSQTEEVDGLREGEEMEFRVWDKSVGMEIPVKTIEYGQGDGTFANEGIYIVDALLAE